MGGHSEWKMWAQDQVSHLTFFFSTQGLEQLSRESAENLLVREVLLKFTSPKRYVYPREIHDESGNAMWSVNVVVGDGDGTFSEGGPSITPYQ